MSDPFATYTASVINPGLYSILNQYFAGGVTIANQGEPMLGTCYREASGRLKMIPSHAGEYYRVNCPFCRDTRKRLWVNHMFGQPGPDNKPMYYLATCYNDNCLENVDNWRKLLDIIFGFRNADSRRNPVMPLNIPQDFDFSAIEKAEPPGDVILLTDLYKRDMQHPAVVYMMQSRRYTLQMLSDYNVSYCVNASPRFREAQGRIIFPCYMHGEFVGWQGRYVGETDWRHTAKYYTMPGFKKTRALYNHDRAKYHPYVVVVEGVTDCHVLGDRAVALLGKTVSPTQQGILATTWAGKPVLLLLDPGTEKETEKAVQGLSGMGVVVLPITLPAPYDCGDYDRSTLLSVIYAQAAARGISLQER